MTNDSIAITIAAFLFACWLAVWLRLQLRPEPPQPPEPADEPEPEGDYYFQVTPERITTGAFARKG